MNTEPTPEQLTLLPEATVPVRFRLDEATRRRGLQHVAEIRRMLATAHAPASVAPGDRTTRRAADDRTTRRVPDDRRAA